MEPTPNSPLSGDHADHTAVVWMDASRPEPAELFAALEGRGIRPVRACSAYTAAAEICRLHKARRRLTPDKPARELLALVVVHPESQPQAWPVHEIMSRYAPETPCWMYGPATAPKLRPVCDDDLAGWSGGRAEPGDAVVVRPVPAQKPAPLVQRPGAPKVKPAPQAPPTPPSSPAPQLRLAGIEALRVTPKASERSADADGGKEEAGVGRGAEGGGGALLPPE
jgi:hypothetical protein